MDHIKKEVKIYLTPKTKKALLGKAEELGFSGRGALSRWLDTIATSKVLFLNENTQNILKATFGIPIINGRETALKT